MTRRSPIFRNGGADERLRELERRWPHEPEAMLEYALELREQGADPGRIIAAFQTAEAARVPGAKLQLALEHERQSRSPDVVLRHLAGALRSREPGAAIETARYIAKTPMPTIHEAFKPAVQEWVARQRLAPDAVRSAWHLRDIVTERVSKPFAEAVQKLRLLAYLGDDDAKRFLAGLGTPEKEKLSELPTGTGRSGLKPFADLGPNVAKSLGFSVMARLALAAVSSVKPSIELWPPGSDEQDANAVTEEMLNSAITAGLRLLELMEEEASDPSIGRRRRDLDEAATTAAKSAFRLPQWAEPETPPLDNKTVVSRAASLCVRVWPLAMVRKAIFASQADLKYQEDLGDSICEHMARLIYRTEVASAWQAQLEEEGFLPPAKLGSFRPWAFFQTVPEPFTDRSKWLKKGKARVKAAMLEAARRFLA